MGKRRDRMEYVEAIAESPVFPIAEELYSGVQEWVSGSSDEDFEDKLASDADEIRDKLIREALAARLGSMPYEKAIELYAKRTGDEEATGFLAQLAALAMQHMRDHDDLLDMRGEAAVAGRVDLDRLHPHDKVVFGLFSERVPVEERRWDSSAKRIEFAAARSPQTTVRGVWFEALGNYSLPIEDDDPLEVGDHNLMLLGGVRRITKDEDLKDGLEPVVTGGTGLRGWRYGRSVPFTTAPKVGYVLVNDFPVLDGPRERLLRPDSNSG